MLLQNLVEGGSFAYPGREHSCRGVWRGKIDHATIDSRVITKRTRPIRICDLEEKRAVHPLTQLGQHGVRKYD